MNPVVQTYEITNAAYPEGGGYRIPDAEHDYWRDPEGNRIEVFNVMDGADETQTAWIADTTIEFFSRTYLNAFHASQAEGLIFRGKGSSKHLLLELQRQLPTGWWKPR